MPNILIVEGDKKVVKILSSCIEKSGWGKKVVKKGSPWMDDMPEEGCHVVIMEFDGEDMHSVKDIISIKGRDPYMQVIMTADPDIHSSHVAAAMNEGAFGFLLKPLEEEKVKVSIRRAMSKCEELMAKDRRTAKLNKEANAVKKEREREKREYQVIKEINRKKNMVIGKLERFAAGKVGIIKALLIGDSAYQLSILKERMERESLEVITAGDADEGLQKALAEKPGVIISDMEMPGMSGVELCRNIKNNEGLDDIYFIICTADIENYDRIMGRGPSMQPTGVDDCICKPSGDDEMAELIARIYIGVL